jgi:DNA-directed RNA polymerase specialized sigma24 family protein
MAISASCSGSQGRPAVTEAPWWERTPEGTPLLLAFVTVLRDEAVDEPAQQQRRYIAGVEYIAGKVGAAQPLRWSGHGVRLILQASEPHAVIAHALSAAEALRERAMVDLSMTVRIAVHAVRAAWSHTLENVAPEEAVRCEQLARAAPAQGIAITEDVYLLLTAPERRRFALLGRGAHDGLAAHVFPSSLALKSSPGTFQPLGDAALWQSFRSYIDSPAVRRLRYVGFPLQKKQPPSLDIREVFIPLEARRLADRPAGSEWTTLARKREEASLPREPLTRFVRAHSALILLGDPGSGKTTVLRWLAVLAAGGPLSWAAHMGISERLLPLLISVGRLAQLRSQLGPDCSVPHALAVYFQDRGVGAETALRPFLEATLEAGECLLLLDGLDEVQNGEQSGVLRWLEAFCARYPGNRFVVSSRWVGYPGFALPEGVTMESGGFQDEQIRQYVRTFERACRRWENDGAPDEAGADQDSDRLLEALFANPRLKDLSQNPLLLSAFALIHRAEGRLPRHRVQAYEIFARALCETWEHARRVVASETAPHTLRYEEEAIPILGELALQLHLHWPAGVAPEAVVIRILSEAIQERTGEGRSEAEHAAREFLERAGQAVQILLERGAGQWGFLHLTFQEFFTAVGLLSKETFESVAFEHLLDPRWEEVIRLGVGYMALIQKRASATQRFIRAVLTHQARSPQQPLASSRGQHVYLAALLASEAGDVLPPVLQEEIAKAVVAWNQSVPATVAAPLLRELAPTGFAERLLDELLSNLSPQEDSGQEKTFLALGVLRGGRSRGALRMAAQARSSRIRAQAARSIVLGGDPLDWETLFLLADDPEAGVRSAAFAGFISSQDSDGRDRTLGLLLGSSRADVLRHAIQTLALTCESASAGGLSTVQTEVVRKAILTGCAHEDESVREEALLLLGMEREHFPEEARAYAKELKNLKALARASLAPAQRSPSTEEDQALHERALQGDPSILSSLMQSFAPWLTSFVQHDLKCDQETAYDSVIDALFSYVQEPQHYDPRKSRLVTYLTRAAKHRARDRLRVWASRVRREQAFVSAIELAFPPPRDSLENFMEASHAFDRLIDQKILKDDRDVALLRSILSGERSTEALAQVLGLSASSPEDMRRKVKQHQDRLMKMLERFGKDGSGSA